MTACGRRSSWIPGSRTPLRRALCLLAMAAAMSAVLSPFEAQSLDVLASTRSLATVAAGEYHSLALRVDGTVSAWGFNYYGALGNGTTSGSGCYCSDIPVQVSGLDSVVAVASGGFHSLALKSDGTVWVWGHASNGELGNGTAPNDGCRCSDVPVQVPGLSGVTAISGGQDDSLALESNGTVWAWGYNPDGALGNGTTSTSPATSSTPSCMCIDVPVQVSGLDGVIAIAAGATSMALKSDGTVWDWGNDYYGTLGNGTTSTTGCQCSDIPVQVLGLSNVTAIASGYCDEFAIKSDGTVWAWGWNVNGQLGNGTTTDSALPVQVLGLTGVKSVAAGDEHSMALRSDGTVWAWGYNYYGQLGNGNNADSYLPVQSSGPQTATAVASGGLHSLALHLGGNVWGWGYNYYGQLGDGATTDSNTAVPSLMSGVAQPGAIRDCTPTPPGAPTAPPPGLNVMTSTDAALTKAGLYVTYPTITPALPGGSVYAYRVGDHIETAAYPPPNFDPLTATPATLVEYGLPPRPDAGAARAEWTALFSGVTFAKPTDRLIAVPNKASSTTGVPSGACVTTNGGVVAKGRSTNWAGYINHDDTSAYVEAGVSYTEPSTSTDVASCGSEMVAMWAGIGGFTQPGSPIIQDGTVTSDPGEGLDHAVWYEDYPNSMFTVGVSIPTGHVVDAVVHYDSGFATYIVKDVTANQIALNTRVPAPAYDGSSAEYIVERPTSNSTGAPFPLLRFSQIDMTHAYWATSQRLGFVGSGANSTGSYMNTSSLPFDWFGDLLADISNLEDDSGNSQSAFSVAWYNCK